MKCDGCQKKEAALVLHMITNGQVATRSLCLDCAKKAHQQMAQAFSTMGMTMSGMEDLRGTPPQQNDDKLRLPKMICATCRTAYEDIDDDTVFGCPKCYQAFHDGVIDYLSSLRGQEIALLDSKKAESHDSLNTVTEIELQERLSSALKSEDYELACTLRDRLKALTNNNEDGVQLEDV